MKFADLKKWLEDETNHDQAGRGKNSFLRTGKYEKTRLQALGISNGRLKKLAGTFYKTNKDLDLTTLMPQIDEVMTSSRIYEYQLLVIYIMERYKKDIRQYHEQIFPLIDNWIDKIDYWALSDHLAMNVFPYLPIRQYTPTLRSWLDSDSYWRRRGALTAYLKHGRKDPDFLPVILEFSSILLPDDNYYIKKAIPWIIRESYRKHEQNRQQVKEFVREHIAFFNKTMLRETIKYLDDDVQKELLDLYDSNK